MVLLFMIEAWVCLSCSIKDFFFFFGSGHFPQKVSLLMIIGTSLRRAPRPSPPQLQLPAITQQPCRLMPARTASCSSLGAKTSLAEPRRPPPNNRIPRPIPHKAPHPRSGHMEIHRVPAGYSHQVDRVGRLTSARFSPWQPVLINMISGSSCVQSHLIHLHPLPWPAPSSTTSCRTAPRCQASRVGSDMAVLDLTADLI